MEKKTRIRKSNVVKSGGYTPGVLYCFNYNLKGRLCNQCDNKDECLNEYNILQKASEEIKRLTLCDINDIYLKVIEIFFE